MSGDELRKTLISRRGTLALAGGAAGVALAGCNSGGEPGLEEQVPETAAALLAAEGGIATDSETNRVLELLGGGVTSPLDAFDQETGLQAVRADQILRFSTSSDALLDRESGATIVRGDYEDDEIRPTFEAARGVRFTEVDYKGESVLVTRPNEDFSSSLAVLGDGEFVFGRRDVVESVLDVRIGDREALSGPLLDAFLDTRDDALVSFALDPPEQDPVGEVPTEQVQEIETLSGSYGTPDDRINLQVTIDASAEEQAVTLQETIGSTIQSFVDDEAFAGPIADELNRIELSREADVLTLGYESSIDDVAALLESLQQGPGSGPGVPGDSVINTRTERTFGSIQAAIDDDQTDDGDTIVVSGQPEGYRESIEISKPLTIIGESEAVIDGEDKTRSNGVAVSAPNVTIQNLTVRGFDGYGIGIFADDARVQSVHSENNTFGLSVEFASNVVMDDVSSVDNEWHGVDCIFASNLEMDQLRIESNDQAGISMTEVQDLQLRDAQITGNTSGAHIVTGENVTLEHVDCSSNEQQGIACLDISNLTLRVVAATNNGNGWGLLVTGATDAVMQDLRLQGNTNGGVVLTSSNVQINDADISDNEYALDVYDSTAVTLRNSSVRSNVQGVLFGRPAGDIGNSGVHANDIVDNERFGVTMEPTVEELSEWVASMDAQADSDPTAEGFYETQNELVAEYGEGRTAVEIGSEADGSPLPATGNWWGDTSGPGGDGPGTGDAVVGTVDYDPWSTNAGPNWNAEGSDGERT